MAKNSSQQKKSEFIAAVCIDMNRPIFKCRFCLPFNSDFMRTQVNRGKVCQKYNMAAWLGQAAMRYKVSCDPKTMGRLNKDEHDWLSENGWLAKQKWAGRVKMGWPAE